MSNLRSILSELDLDMHENRPENIVNPLGVDQVIITSELISWCLRTSIRSLNEGTEPVEVFEVCSIAENLLRKFELKKMLFATYAPGWRFTQAEEVGKQEYVGFISILLFASEYLRDIRYTNAVLKALDLLSRKGYQQDEFLVLKELSLKQVENLCI